jgi:hypothetical protein
MSGLSPTLPLDQQHRERGKKFLSIYIDRASLCVQINVYIIYPPENCNGSESAAVNMYRTREEQLALVHFLLSTQPRQLSAAVAANNLDTLPLPLLSSDADTTKQNNKCV